MNFSRNIQNLQLTEDTRNDYELQNLGSITNCNIAEGFRIERRFENHDSTGSNMIRNPQNMGLIRGRKNKDDAIYYDEPVILHKCTWLVKPILNIKKHILLCGTSYWIQKVILIVFSLYKGFYYMLNIFTVLIVLFDLCSQTRP